MEKSDGGRAVGVDDLEETTETDAFDRVARAVALVWLVSAVAHYRENHI